MAGKEKEEEERGGKKSKGERGEEAEVRNHVVFVSFLPFSSSLARSFVGSSSSFWLEP